MHPTEMPFTATLIEALIRSDLQDIQNHLDNDEVDSASTIWDRLAKTIATKKYMFEGHDIVAAELEPVLDQMLRRLETHGHVSLARHSLEVNRRLVDAGSNVASQPTRSRTLNLVANTVPSSSH